MNDDGKWFVYTSLRVRHLEFHPLRTMNPRVGRDEIRRDHSFHRRRQWTT